MIFQCLFRQADPALILRNMAALLIVLDSDLYCFFDALANDMIKDSGSITSCRASLRPDSVVVVFVWTVNIEAGFKDVHQALVFDSL